MMDFGKAAQLLQGLKNAGKNMPVIEQSMNQLQTKLSSIQIEGIAGGGAVKIILNGHMECKQVIIDKAILKSASSSPVIIEDLLRTAVNDGIKRASEAVTNEHMEFSKEMMGKMMGGGGFGGMGEFLKGFPGSSSGGGDNGSSGKKELK